MEEATKRYRSTKTESDTNLLNLKSSIRETPRKQRGQSVRVTKRPITCHRSYTSKYSSSPDKIKELRIGEESLSRSNTQTQRQLSDLRENSEYSNARSVSSFQRNIKTRVFTSRG